MRKSFHPGPTSGHLSPAAAWVGLAVVLAAVIWAVLGGDSGSLEELDPPAVELETPENPPFGLKSAAPEELPTPSYIDGPLVAELRFLGGLQQEKIRPKRAGALQGSVLDHNREGIEGVRIMILGGPQDGWGTLSKKGGQFFFPELLPGTHYFQLQIPQFGTTVRSQRVQLNGTTKRDFLVAPPMGVELEIRDSQNKLLPGAKAVADLTGIETLSDEQGIARLHGIVGGERVLVTIRAEGHVPVRVELNLRKQPSNAAPIPVPALPKGGVIQGVVRSWPGNPLPTISIVPRSNRIGTHRIAWETWQGVEVGSDGRFRLENLPTSHLVDFRVFHPKGVTEPAHRAVRVNKSSPTTLDFIIKRGKGRVKGQVLGADGEPVSRAKLVLETADPSAMLGRIYPGLADVPSTTRLPVPAAMRREMKATSRGKFDFAWGDHPQGTGSLVLTASAPGFQPKRVSIKRSYEDLKIHLAKVDRSGELLLVAGDGIGVDGPKELEVRWYLDGLLAEGQDGLTVDGLSLGGLSTGTYELVVKAGEKVVLQRAQFDLHGPLKLSLQ